MLSPPLSCHDSPTGADRKGVVTKRGFSPCSRALTFPLSSVTGRNLFSLSKTKMRDFAPPDPDAIDDKEQHPWVYPDHVRSAKYRELAGLIWTVNARGILEAIIRYLGDVTKLVSWHCRSGRCIYTKILLTLSNLSYLRVPLFVTYRTLI